MPFKTLLAVTGTDVSNDDIKLAAGLCEETGIHLATTFPGLSWCRFPNRSFVEMQKRPN